QHDLEGFGDLLGRSTTAYVQEVSGVAAVQLDGVHSGHGQACPVNQAANIAVQLNIGKVVFTGFYLGGIFFVQVTVGQNLGLAEQRVRIEIELGIKRDDIARTCHDQRVDFSQRCIGFPVSLI